MTTTLAPLDYDDAAIRRINDARNLSDAPALRPGYEPCLTAGGFVIEKRAAFRLPFSAEDLEAAFYEAALRGITGA